MVLKVIGSGLGRTGTLSLKLALEALGFGPCHHMVEVFMHPDSVPLWVNAADGKPDWDRIYQGYAASVDYPGAHYWRQLAEHYPTAKIIHTVRDPDRWFDSTQATIFAPNTLGTEPPPHMKRFFESLLGRFGEKLHDRAFMTAHFEAHTREVERTIPKERLLIYEAGQGWEPLCQFLGVDVPDAPYPRENSREDFVAGGHSDGPPDPAAMRARLESKRPLQA